LLVILAGSFVTATASAKNVSTTSAGLSEVEVHNHTPYVVAVYVDGDFEGYLRPHSHMSVLAVSGRTSLRARADFTNGPSLTWKSTVFLNPGASYPWVLEP
jgi:hypothetical protein